MRNWVQDKFGRNRIRNRPAQPAPAPALSTTAPVREEVGTVYNVVYTNGGTITFPRGTFASAGTNWWVQNIWDDPYPPAIPEKLRLPEGV